MLENNRYGASESSDYIAFYKYNLLSYAGTDFTIETVYGNIGILFTITKDSQLFYNNVVYDAIEAKTGFVFKITESFDPLKSNFVVVGYANMYSHGGGIGISGKCEYPVIVTFKALTREDVKD